MSARKKEIRQRFRDACFARDGYRCVVCGFPSSPGRALEELDAHHITDRSEMPNGGYVRQNGATLCKVGNNCHALAERWHASGGETCPEGYRPEDLYALIGSSYEEALQASEALES